jgi:hypothetical protein
MDRMEGTPEAKVLADWCDAAAAELGLAGHELTEHDRDAILGLAGVAAHAVLRPAAPLTTFLAGYAAGLRSSPDARGALDGPIAKLSALAHTYADQAGKADGHGGTGAGDKAAHA